MQQNTRSQISLWTHYRLQALMAQCETVLSIILHRGNLFIKTGTLNGVRAIAGYVNSRSGQRYTVATIQQHPGLG